MCSLIFSGMSHQVKLRDCFNGRTGRFLTVLALAWTASRSCAVVYSQASKTIHAAAGGGPGDDAVTALALAPDGDLGIGARFVDDVRIGTNSLTSPGVSGAWV